MAVTRTTEAGWGPSDARPRIFGLDLVRAAAILLVLTGHFGTAAAELTHERVPLIFVKAAYCGVELFFALSGLLIGGLLLEIADRPVNSRSWLVFMVRRWMRTIPLYVFWLVFLLAAWPPHHGSTRHFLQYATFTQNFAHRMPSDGWFPVSWSLAVEEWFYLLFSATLIGLAALRSRKAALISCLIFIACPLLARIMFTSQTVLWDEDLRKIAVLRFDAIAWGAWLALLIRSHPVEVARWSLGMLVTGLVLVVLTTDALLFPPSPGYRPWLLSLSSIAFALCLPAAVGMRFPSSFIVQVVTWFSRRSYSLYLIHLSMVEFGLDIVRNGWIERWECLTLIVGISLILAELLYRFIEEPILRCRPKQFPTPFVTRPTVVTRVFDQGAAHNASKTAGSLAHVDLSEPGRP